MRRGVVANSQLLRNIKGLSHRKSLNSLFSASKGNISLLNYTKPYTTATTASATVASHIMAERSTTDIKNVSVPDCSKATASSSAQDPSIDKAETEEKKEEEKLPPLSAHEFQIYNRPSARMDAFVSHPSPSIATTQSPLLQPNANNICHSTTTFAKPGTPSGKHA